MQTAGVPTRARPSTAIPSFITCCSIPTGTAPSASSRWAEIVGLEHGQSADRPTTDLPSVRMWLELLPEGTGPRARRLGLLVVHGGSLHVSPVRHGRAREHRRRRRGGRPDFDIVDDASHASHHQQNAFLEPFPKSPRGGLYIIEDLRWQPEAYERPGITRSADLFRAFLQSVSFATPTPAPRRSSMPLARRFPGASSLPGALRQDPPRSGRGDLQALAHQAPRGLARSVGACTAGSSGQGCRHRRDVRTSA